MLTLKSAPGKEPTTPIGNILLLPIVPDHVSSPNTVPSNNLTGYDVV